MGGFHRSSVDTARIEGYPLIGTLSEGKSFVNLADESPDVDLRCQVQRYPLTGAVR
jgi:hypothetical protein